MYPILKSIILYTLFLFIPPFLMAQDKPLEQDTVQVKGGSVILLADTVIHIANDTTLIFESAQPFEILDRKETKETFDSLKVKAGKRAVTRQLYNLLVRSSYQFQDDIGDGIVRSEEVFMPFDGMKIREIRLKQVPIIEGSVFDTTAQYSYSNETFIDKLHSTTKPNIVKNNLLFKEGEKLDAFQMADNERIIRELPYIEDARLWVEPVKDSLDLVDVIVVVKDQFSVGATASVNSLNDFSVKLFERNLIGTGGEVSYEFFFNSDHPTPIGHGVRYLPRNIAGTFIDGEIGYSTVEDETIFDVQLDREFLTPQTRWAGAFRVADVALKKEESSADSSFIVPYQADFLDIWVGRAFRVGERAERKNFIVSGRWTTHFFSERPAVSLAENQFYHHRKLFLGRFEYVKWKFFKTRMVLGFGRTEDILEGYQMGITAGAENGEFENLPYFGVDGAHAKYIDGVGYLAGRFEVGAFKAENIWKDIGFSLKGLYFTELQKLANVKVRHLFAVDYLLGFNRRNREDLLNLKALRGYSDDLPEGDKRLLFSYETIFFMPWNWYGFRFAPFTFAQMGAVGTEGLLISLGDFRYSFGVGFRIRNESLVFQTINVRLAYLPVVEDGSPHVSFDISGTDPSFSNDIRTSEPNIFEFK